MMQTASTFTGTGGMRIITTIPTRTIGEMTTLMSTAMQTAAIAATVHTRTIRATHTPMSTATQIAATVAILHTKNRILLASE